MNQQIGNLYKEKYNYSFKMSIKILYLKSAMTEMNNSSDGCNSRSEVAGEIFRNLKINKCKIFKSEEQSEAQLKKNKKSCWNKWDNIRYP